MNILDDENIKKHIKIDDKKKKQLKRLKQSHITAIAVTVVIFSLYGIVRSLIDLYNLIF